MSTPGVRPMTATRCPEVMLSGPLNAIWPSTVRPLGPAAGAGPEGATSTSISEGIAMVRPWADGDEPSALTGGGPHPGDDGREGSCPGADTPGLRRETREPRNIGTSVTGTHW